MKSATSNRLMKSYESAAYYGEFPVDLCSGKHLILDIHILLSTSKLVIQKAPFFQVIDSKQQNGSVCELEPTHRIDFSNLHNKNTQSNTIQSISIVFAQKRENCEGRISPFRNG